MEYDKFLTKIIDDGIEAAKKDYANREEPNYLLNGSVAGFEACRGKNPQELKQLLDDAQAKQEEALLNKAEDYWYHRGFESEVEWVCNVISAILMNQDMPVIITPTARGVMRTADIVGVKS